MNKKLAAFRQWRWFMPVMAGGIVVVLMVPTYFVALHFNQVPATFKPSAILNNPLGSASRILGGGTPAPSGEAAPSSSPGAQKPGTTASPGTGETAKKTASTSSGSPSSAPAAGRQLVLDHSTITLEGGSVNTPAYRASTAMRVAPGLKLYSPVISGSKADVGIVPLPVMSDCPYSNGEWCPTWNLGAQRIHPEGSGTSYFTVTTHDEAGNQYSAKLTVIWKPIPYFTLAPGRVEVITGNSPQWGNLTGVIVHVTLQPHGNFGSPIMRYNASLPGYPCMGTPGVTSDPYHNNYTYAGNNDLAISCWFYESQADSVRQHAVTAHVSVAANGLFTDFENGSIDVTVPAW